MIEVLRNFLFGAGVRFGAVRRVLVVFALVVSFVNGSADTCVLGTDGIKAIVPSDKPAEFHTINLLQGGVPWQLEIGLNAPGKVRAPISFTDGRYMLIRANNGTVDWCMKSLSLKTDFFKNKLVKSISIDALCMRRGIDDPGIQTVTITDGSQTVASNDTPLYTDNSYPKTQQEVITFAVDKVLEGSLGISFTSTIDFEFAFHSITIEYDTTIPPVVGREATIPVGHPLWLTADKEDAVIYYTVDGTEDWQTYNPGRGVVFVTPGTYTLKYYATLGEVYSKVVSEEIKAVKPESLDAARAANEEITVSGEILEHGSGYVLIGEDEQCDPEDYVAIDCANYTQLTTAPAGTKITAAGRPTDRFGRDVKALGSISSLEIDGEPSEPAVIINAATAPAAEARYYDLGGRRVDRSTRHMRRILISTDGAKRLN